MSRWIGVECFWHQANTADFKVKRKEMADTASVMAEMATSLRLDCASGLFKVPPGSVAIELIKRRP
jgi:hypothetical protein